MVDLSRISERALNEFYGKDSNFTQEIDISGLHWSYLENLRGILENDGMIIIDETPSKMIVSLTPSVVA
jgi:hypothetical protein